MIIDENTTSYVIDIKFTKFRTVKDVDESAIIGVNIDGLYFIKLN